MTKSLFKTYIYLFSSLILSPTYGQNNKVNNTTQLCSEVDLLGLINKKWKWQCDFQYSIQSPYENVDFLKYAQQLTIRPWIIYYPKTNIEISAFAGLWYNYFIGGNLSQRQYPEYRTALQIQFYKTLQRNTFSFRFRTELREIKDKPGNFETVFRERTMLKFQRLLTHKIYEKNSVYLIAEGEVFFNDGSSVTGYKIFDQNTIFVGLGYNITNAIAIESGYFNQFAYHAHDTKFDSNHIFQVSLILDSLTKGKHEN